MATVWTVILTFLKKHWKTIAVVAVVAGLAVTATIYIKKYRSAEREISGYAVNNKALIDRLNGKDNDIYEMQLRISDMEYMNDSISNKLLATVEELGIKEKQVQRLQYLYSHFERKDSIVFCHDTIFREPDFALDTVIGDKWMSTELQMRYPNIVCVSPSVRSEKTVVVYSKREPIRPSKCKFVNLFRKKQTVTKVIINEENPYIESQDNVFIEVTK